MGSVDRAAIGWTIAVVLIGAGIAAIGIGSSDDYESDEIPAMMDSMEKEMIKDTPKDTSASEMTAMEKMMDEARTLQEKDEMMKDEMMKDEMMKDEMMKDEMMKDEMMKDEMMKDEMMKTPITKYVSIPAETSIPGCELTDACFIPFSVSINAKDSVTWTNDDTAIHTVTSGEINNGSNGIFDSSLIQGGSTFTVQFDDFGTFEYFCIVHPWMSGSISVN
ncbi:MAG: copper binding protein [Cenarchaeum symbiont of Oopsacas minuta]|nr:copper binding protein [Cenarchaeum symbiont of Oopsacas minuta]